MSIPLVRRVSDAELIAEIARLRSQVIGDALKLEVAAEVFERQRREIEELKARIHDAVIANVAGGA